MCIIQGEGENQSWGNYGLVKIVSNCTQYDTAVVIKSMDFGKLQLPFPEVVTSYNFFLKQKRKKSVVPKGEIAMNEGWVSRANITECT